VIRLLLFAFAARCFMTLYDLYQAFHDDGLLDLLCRVRGRFQRVCSIVEAQYDPFFKLAVFLDLSCQCVQSQLFALGSRRFAAPVSCQNAQAVDQLLVRMTSPSSGAAAGWHEDIRPPFVPWNHRRHLLLAQALRNSLEQCLMGTLMRAVKLSTTPSDENDVCSP